MADDIREWWIKTLLGQQRSAHPVFGEQVEVQVDGSVVTLKGTVETLDEAQQIEREALQIDTVDKVNNHLCVTGGDEVYHSQTVIAVFRDKGAAQLAQQAAQYWTVHNGDEPQLIEDAETARHELSGLATAAQIPPDAVDQFETAVEDGKVLLVGRVPEDDALRIVSELEGSRAELVRTLPPEPDSTKTE